MTPNDNAKIDEINAQIYKDLDAALVAEVSARVKQIDMVQAEISALHKARDVLQRVYDNARRRNAK